LSLVVVVLQRFSALHGLGTDLRRPIRRMRLHSNRPPLGDRAERRACGCRVRGAAAAGVRPWRDEWRRSRERVRTSSNAAVIALQGRRNRSLFSQAAERSLTLRWVRGGHAEIIQHRAFEPNRRPSKTSGQ
jgi:hypothetical protein